jgi:hypothetical protein
MRVGLPAMKGTPFSPSGLSDHERFIKRINPFLKTKDSYHG